MQLITFDPEGVSHHVNHKAVWAGVHQYVQGCERNCPLAWMLVSAKKSAACAVKLVFDCVAAVVVLLSFLHLAIVLKTHDDALFTSTWIVCRENAFHDREDLRKNIRDICIHVP